MGLSSLLGRLATDAPVAVTVVAGADAGDVAPDLCLRPEVSLVTGPRQAEVLLLAGTCTDDLLRAALAAHDAIPPPRIVLAWRAAPGDVVSAAFPGVERCEDEDPVPTLRRIAAELRTGQRPSSPLRGAPTARSAWRGVGPFGQGGRGRRGGEPYGRPLARRETARDGLLIDALEVPVGPLQTGVPDGFTGTITFHGDLVARLEVGRNPFLSPHLTGCQPAFLRSLEHPVAVEELELERARALLRAVAWTLRVHGLVSLGERVLRLAAGLRPQDQDQVVRLRRFVTRWAVSGGQLRRVGVIDPALLAGRSLGPLARAAGLTEDLRAEDPAYLALGFELANEAANNDAAGRLRQRLMETEQALQLAQRAGPEAVRAPGPVEGPRGVIRAGSAPADRLEPLLPQLVVGLGWQDVAGLLASLDLDRREAAWVAATTSPASGARR